MTEAQIEKEEDQLEREIAKYGLEPLDLKYYERALGLQSKKINAQAVELARMSRIYGRNVKATSVGQAIWFLFQVIRAKIKV